MTQSLTTWQRAALGLVLTFAGMLSVSARIAAQAVRAAAPAVIEGLVTTQRGTIPLGGAQVVVRDATDHEVAATLTEGDGRFHIADIGPGKHTVIVTLDGFDAGRTTTIVSAGATTTLNFDLPIATLTTTVDVVAPPSPVVSSGDTLAGADDITNKDTDRLAPGGGLQAALRLLASVIEVPGGVSIKGGRPDQAGTQIGASTLADPGIGTAHFNLPDDAIDSVAVLPNPYAVEYGRFSSGLVVIRTRRGGDEWRIRLNNLDPTLRAKRHQDLYTVTGISAFGPRLELGGPIVKDRLFLEQTAQYRYSASDVPSRPENELMTTQWFSSFSRVDANLSPTHSLVGSVGLFPSSTKQALLGTFVPPNSTVNLDERANYGAITERALWSDRFVGETTLQVHEYRAEVMPQGSALMELWPDTRAGNFYNSQRRTSSTFQWIETLSGSANGPTGLHLFKIGVDVLHNGYQGWSSSRPILVKRNDGTLARRFDFAGPTNDQVQSTDIALFAQDRVQPTTRWYVEYGARLDRDGVLAQWNLTPRIGSALLLNESGSQVLRGGLGLFYERTPSAAGAFDRFESSIDSRFAPDGLSLIG
ncbi:MAG TPA: carboxypeptidase regulatory-like domain-containing protein, partial [Rhodanobacteraceae bacterium]